MSTPVINLRDYSNSPYEGVYTILHKGYIGCWADADALYGKIRDDAIWSELKQLIAVKPTKASTERAAVLLEELNRVTYSRKSFKDAEQVVKSWAPPPKPVAVISAVKKPAAIQNSFALLVGDDEDN